jgi:GTPase SAR1 family protein
MFVYDITSMDSFEAVSNWMEFASKNAPQNVVKVLCGNKSDQEKNRIVDYRCGKVTTIL